jgi:excisionase family DNA binding protein
MTAPADALERAVADALANTLPTVVADLAAVAGPRAYSVREVAERLDVAENTVYKLIRAGRLRTVPHLNPARVSSAALLEFLEARP